MYRFYTYTFNMKEFFKEKKDSQICTPLQTQLLQTTECFAYIFVFLHTDGCYPMPFIVVSWANGTSFQKRLPICPLEIRELESIRLLGHCQMIPQITYNAFLSVVYAFSECHLHLEKFTELAFLQNINLYSVERNPIKCSICMLLLKWVESWSISF